MKANAALAWLCVVGFTVGAAWPLVFGEPVPLVGLRGFSTSPMAWPVVLATAFFALYLSLPRLHTRNRLVAGIAVSITLFIVVAFFIGMAAGVLLVFLAANLYRETRLAKPAH